MKMLVEMSTVSKCSVRKCAYNKSGGCHARAITVGDASNPRCDTFFENRTHTRERNSTAGVGACKVADCKYNVDYECAAKGIRVGVSRDQVKCLTFEAR